MKVKGLIASIGSCILFGVVGAYLALHHARAGTPAPSCPVPGHEGPNCHMGTCTSYGKDGKLNGAKCSKDCAEKCCGCDTKCNRHHETSPEEHMWHM